MNDLVTTTDIAKLTGLTIGNVMKYAMNKGFPDPVYRVARIRLWSRKDILAWKKNRRDGRKRAA